MRKYTLEELPARLDRPKRETCRKIIADYADVFSVIPGSSAKHQSWPGGYISHLEETMNIALSLHRSMNKRRRLPFSAGEGVFALFLHDMDKLMRYKKVGNKFTAITEHNDRYAEKISGLLTEKYGYKLSPAEYNAIKYAHGEGHDYHPLTGSFCH